MDVFPLVIFFAVAGALVLLAAHISRKRIVAMRPRGPQYVWIAVISRPLGGRGPIYTRQNAESTKGTHRAAYLLMRAGLRMRLVMARIHIEHGDPTGWASHRIAERASYSTEAFRPHKADIRSLEDFSRYAPYRADWLMHLSVHPEDVQEAVRLLQEAGLVVELPPGRHWWH